MGVFDITTVDEWGQKIQRGINAPVVNVTKSTLGGPERVSLLLLVALDKREDWPNNILENSRYFRLHLSNDGTLEMFSGHVRPAKNFRKTRVTSADDVVAKVNRYVIEANRVANMATMASEMLKIAKSLVAEPLHVIDGYRNVVRVIRHRGFKVYIQQFHSGRFGDIFQIQNNIGEPWTDSPPAFGDMEEAVEQGRKIVDEYVDGL